LHPIDSVGKPNFGVGAAGNSEAERERLSSGGSAVALSAGELAHPGIKEPGLISAGSFTVSGVGGSKVAVRQTLLKDGAGNLAMERQPFRLLIFLVPSEIKPAQTLKDGANRGVGVALDVGIIEAEDHGSMVVTGVKPIENEGASAADMQKTGGRRRKTNAKHNF